MDVLLLTQLAITHLVAMSTPGPDFLLILRNALRHGPRAASWTSFGIMLGVVFHLAYAFGGFALLLTTERWLYLTIATLGALYLLYLGVQSWRAPATWTGDLEAEASAAAGWTPLAMVRQGFLTNVLNVKASLFFLSLVNVIASTRAPVAVQGGFGLWLLFQNFAWFTLLGALAGHAWVRRKLARYAGWLDRATGVLFILLAASLLVHLVATS